MKKNIFFVGVFSVYFYIFYSQIYRQSEGFPSDFPAHINIALDFFKGESFLPHPGFYIISKFFDIFLPLNFEQASICVLALSVTGYSYIIFNVLQKETDKALEYTMVLMLVTSIFIPFFNQLYLGQGSANIYHNPTLVIVKPFAYLALILFIKMLGNHNKKNLFLAAAILTIGVIMKPNFIFAFLVAVPIYLLCKKSNRKQWVYSGFMILPTLFVLAFQYFKTYNSETSSSIVIDPFGVWNLYSPSPFISVLLSSAFPLALLIFRYKNVWTSRYLLCSWIGLGISYAEFALLAEGGARYTHGNFSWGIQIFIPLVFLFSIVELIRWKKEKGLNWKVNCVQTLLSLHLLSGLYYIICIMLGYSYI